MKKTFLPLASILTVMMIAGPTHAQVIDTTVAPPAASISYEAQQKIQRVRDLVSAAASHGLMASLYFTAAVEADLQNLALVDNIAGLSTKLTTIVNRLASDLSRGRILPSALSEKTALDDKTFTFKLVADSFVNGSMSAYEFISTVAPKNRIYSEAQAVVQKLMDLKAQGSWTAKPSSLVLATVKAGVKNSALISYARRQLNNFGYYNNTSSTVYDQDLKNAIIAFQTDNGLAADGVAGTSVTWKYLDKNIDQLLTQAILNLDRTRWLPAQNTTEYIFINLARQRFQYFENEIATLDFKTVNGRLDRQTPIMLDKATHVIMNPTWGVTNNIYTKDKIPLMRATNGNYTNEHHMKVYTLRSKDESQPLDPLTIDWNQEPAQLPYRIVQDPGPWNALGFIKFPLTNGFSIYMHDTNERNLFDPSNTNRLRSSGCIRLEKPFDVAEKLLASPEYTAQRIKDLTENLKDAYGMPIVAEKPTRVNLKRSVPVYIFYQTLLNSSGKIIAGNDPYEIDKAMYSLLMSGK